MFVLSRIGILQNGELRRGQELCWYVFPAPRPSHYTHAAEGRLLEKEPTNLQAQSLNALIEDKATRGESYLSNISRYPLTHSPRRIYRNGHRRRRRSRWCLVAHELSKAGCAQMTLTYNRFSNAVALVMLSRCLRIECLPMNAPHSLRHSSSYYTTSGRLRYFTINLFSHRIRPTSNT